MLQEGAKVKTGLKIGDVDPRKIRNYDYLISDKSNKIGDRSKAANERLSDEGYAMILLAAGKSEADMAIINCWKNWMMERCMNIRCGRCGHFHYVRR